MNKPGIKSGCKQSGIKLTSIALALSLVGCGSSSKSPDPQPRPSEFEEFQGVWQFPAEGKVWQFTEDQLHTFNVNQYGCVALPTQPLSGLTHLKSYLAVQTDLQRFYYANPTVTHSYADKLEALPVNCEQDKLLDTNSPVANFEFFWHTFNDYYGFFELRGVDWQQVYDAYRPMISEQTTEEELVSIFEDIIQGFSDGHLGIQGEGDIDISGFHVAGILKSILQMNASSGADLTELYEYLTQSNEEIILSMLDGEPKGPEDGALNWGILPGNIGYVRIHRMNSAFNEEADFDVNNLAYLLAYVDQDLINIDTVMADLIDDLSATNGLIIDTRMNPGGYDNFGLAIARHFNDEERTVGFKQHSNRTINSQRQQDNWTTVTLPQSPIVAYTKPIKLIQGGSTGSAAEVFSLAMSALPHVEILGEATSGNVSDTFDVKMPNGWDISLTHVHFQDANRQLIEETGVQTDQQVAPYSSMDMVYATDTPVEVALKKLNAEVGQPFTQAQMENHITEVLSEFNIPSISAAVVKNGEVIWSGGFGYSDIENEVKANADTPYNIGSISKTFLGTAMAQMMEADLFTLDTAIDDLQLPFNVANPMSEQSITFRHLVTHTSGITDTMGGYGCSYYDHETGQSLYNLVLQSDLCPQEVQMDPVAFINNYFAPAGNHMDEQGFLPMEMGTPGQIFHYSNVATGVAAFSIEYGLGINVQQWMQQNIFAPLDMSATDWDYKKLSNKAVQYTLDEQGNAHRLPEYSYTTRYDGDLNTSANDLAKYMIAIRNLGTANEQRILTPESVAKMLSPQTDVLTSSDAQGIFWVSEGSFVGHDGGDPGTVAKMQYNKNTDVGIILLSNGEDGYLGEDTLDDVHQSLAQLLYQYGLRY